MASKRMFACSITDTDAFLDMSSGAQLLYFHVGMRADDEGFFNNARTIMRLIGVEQEQLNELLETGFLFDLGDSVYVVRDWYINNNLESSVKKKPTIFADKKKLLGGGVIRNPETGKNKGTAYFLKADNADTLERHSILTETSQDNVGQVSLAYRGEEISVGLGECEGEGQDEYHVEFKELEEIYPNVDDHAVAFFEYVSERGRGTSFEDIRDGMSRYLRDIDVREAAPLAMFLKSGLWQ